MPIYEYACTACGERIEARQSFTDAPLEICEICGGKLRKLYSPVGIVFKGSGFYATDGKNKKGGSGSSASAASSGDSSGETKTESKPKSENKTQNEKSQSASTKKETPKK